MKTKQVKKMKPKKGQKPYILAVPVRPNLNTLDKKRLQERILELEAMLQEVIEERDGIYREYCRGRNEFVRLSMTRDEMEYQMRHGVSGQEILAELDAIVSTAK